MKISTAFGARWIILVPMAICISFLLVSQDQMIRLVSLIALIVLEQMREWLLISSIKSLGKGNKP